ncbi:hypothetical protein BJF79_17775 [Actinomadura sp. CNU-125]|nr:hypothetical protein BJF79_17775 [Actinomadura sp. CNU-125]
MVTAADEFMKARTAAAGEKTGGRKSRERPMAAAHRQADPLAGVSMAGLEAWRDTALQSMDRVGSVRTHDPSASVTVVLDGSGELHSVEIVPEWRRRLSPEGLEPALAQAISAAYRQYSETWLGILADDMAGSPPHTGRPEPHRDAGSFRRARTVDEFDAGDRHLVDMLHELDRHTERLEAAAAADRNREVDGGRAVPVVSGGRITGIRLDPNWIHRAPSSQIADEINRAISTAKQTGDDQKIAEIRSRIEEITRSMRSM